MTEKKKRERGSTVERFLEIVDFTSRNDGQFTESHSIDKLSYPTFSAHKLFDDLKAANILQDSILGRVAFSPKFRNLSFDVLSHSMFREKRLKILQALSDDIGESCGISIAKGVHMIYFERAETNWPLQVHLPIGTNVPMHATASGKMYLSSLPSSAQDLYIQNIRLDSLTKNTITNPREFKQALEQIKDRGYSTDSEEFIDGMSALAIPINHSEFTFGYLFCHAPSFRKSISDMEQDLSKIKVAAEKIVAATLESLTKEI